VKDLFAVLGLILIAVGCWQVYRPVALIVVGTLLLVGGVHAKLRSMRR
jgi:hypothetical protein